MARAFGCKITGSLDFGSLGMRHFSHHRLCLTGSYWLLQKCWWRVAGNPSKIPGCGPGPCRTRSGALGRARARAGPSGLALRRARACSGPPGPLGSQILNAKSQIPNPKSNLPNAEFQTRNPKSPIPNPPAQIPYPKSQSPSPGSQIPYPKSQIPHSQTRIPTPKPQNPKSQNPKPESQTPNPGSQMLNPNAQIPNPRGLLEVGSLGVWIFGLSPLISLGHQANIFRSHLLSPVPEACD